jgi:hypothetical protein
MRRDLPGTFKTTAGGFNSWDQIDIPGIGIGPIVSRTPGAVTYTPAGLQGPTPQQNWTLLSVSVQAYLAMSALISAPAGMFGKLAPIQTGLVLNNQTAPTNAPYTQPIDNAPTDNTLITTLWDPTTDDMPPTLASGAGSAIAEFKSVSSALIPAEPIQLTPGVTPVMTLRLNPSILGAVAGGVFGLMLAFGTFTINYDDGL